MNFRWLLLVALVSCNAVAETEITPIVGYRTSGEFKDEISGATLDLNDTSSLGFIVNIDEKPGLQYEFYISHQSTRLKSSEAVSSDVIFDLDITTAHIGGVALFPIEENINAFFGAGIGATHFSPGVANYSSETEFSFNLNGGVKVALTENAGIKVGARFLGTSVNGSGSVFCSEGCRITYTSSIFKQYEVNAGLYYRF